MRFRVWEQLRQSPEKENGLFSHGEAVVFLTSAVAYRLSTHANIAPSSFPEINALGYSFQDVMSLVDLQAQTRLSQIGRASKFRGHGGKTHMRIE